MALVGCTASGKSALAVEVARRLGDVEILTVDSMQVYRGMDIGTAKPSRAEQELVPHHLIDLADPDEEWSVTRWVAEARRCLREIESRGKRALLVGGTGLYFQALIDGLQPPGQWPEVKADLEVDQDTAGLHRRLGLLDPLAAAKIEPANRRRIIRALEVCLGSGRPFSSFGPGMGRYPETSWSIAGLWLPREVIRGRIAERFETMIGAGLVGEVTRLREAPGGMAKTARQALGYREILAHIEGDVALHAASEEAIRRTRAFARRQRVWWRRDPRVAWYGALENPFAVMGQILGNWSRR